MSNQSITRIDFEIAFTASLSALVIAFPLSELDSYILIKLLAISLLILTLIRRIVLMSDIESMDSILRKTNYLLEFSTCVSLLYLFYYYVFLLLGNVGTFFYITFSVVTFVAVILVLIIHENNLRDLLHLVARKFRQKHPVMPDKYVSKASQKHPGYQATLNDWGVFPSEIEEQNTNSSISRLRILVVFMIAVAFLPIIYLITFFSEMGLFTSVFFFIAVYGLKGIIKMYYWVYGLYELGDQSARYDFLNTIMTYAFAVYIFAYV